MKLRSHRWSPIAILGALAVLVLLAYGFGIDAHGFYWVDFPVFYQAGQKALAHHTVYDVVGHYQFKYSPFIALVFGWVWGWAPFACASWVFQKSMFVLYLLLASLLCWEASRSSGKGSLPRTLETGLVLLFWLLGALTLELKLGQINAIVIALVCALFVPIRIRGSDFSVQNPVWRGLLLSLALQIKLYVVIFGVLLLLRRRWAEIAATTGWTVFLCGGVLSLVHGPQMAWGESWAWAISLTRSSSELIAHHTNAGLLGFYSRLGGRSLGSWLWLISLLGYGAILLHARKWKKDPELGRWEIRWALLGILLFNPLVWSYWILLLLPLLAPLARLGLDVLQSEVHWTKKLTVVGISLSLALLWNFQQAHATRLYGVLVGTGVVAVLSLRTPPRKRGIS